MAVFSKKQLLQASPSQMPQMAEAIRREFEVDGFDVSIDTLLSGGSDISITKGSIFKAVLGMRSALKVKLIPQTDGVLFDASVGIFGQQAIPTVISMFFFWPVLLTQIWGLIQQSSLDDRALSAAERVISSSSTASNISGSNQPTGSFCPYCGKPVSRDAVYCPNCGKKLLTI